MVRLLKGFLEISLRHEVPAVLNDYRNQPQQAQQEPLVCISGWLIRHRDPINSPPYDTHAHSHMLTHSLKLGKGDSCCHGLQFTGGGGRCPRGMGRLPVCHINNSQVGWSGVINMASHCRPSEPRNPGVMAAAGAWFPEGQLRKRRWLWGTSALISPLRLEPAASQPGIHFNLCIYRERQDRDLIILSERAERLVYILAYRWTRPLFLYFGINWFFNNYTSYLCPCICLYYDLIFGTCVWWDSLSLFSRPWKIQCKPARVLKLMNTVLFINQRGTNQSIAPCMWPTIMKRL